MESGFPQVAESRNPHPWENRIPHLYASSQASPGRSLMVKKRMYQKVHTLKKKGLSKVQTGKELGLDRKTVRKYWNMSEMEFQEYQSNMRYRDKKLDSYKECILEIYRENAFRKLNMTSVYDCLEERHGNLQCTEKSLRNYIRYLIEIQELEIKEFIRGYSQVPELAFGKQMQLDFGPYRLENGPEIYIFASLLSASRYKFVALQNRPFRTLDIILHLLDAFEYYGGIPEELVIDQDAALVVSENHGDIIYTRIFKEFISEMELKMRVCRKADPESKGKVENLVKYVKYNYLDIRRFSELTDAQSSLSDWLERRANGKISSANNRIPAELILEERNHLRKLRNSIFRKDSLIVREERLATGKSFISVEGAQYSVPVKFRNQKVEIYKTQKQLFIFDRNTGEEIAAHNSALFSGQKVINRAHFRQLHERGEDLKKEIFALHFGVPGWEEFIKENMKRYARYSRDQFIEARKYFSTEIDESILTEALKFCREAETYSFANLNDTYQYFLNESALNSGQASAPTISSAPKRNKSQPDVNIRKLSVYKSVVSGGQAS